MLAFFGFPLGGLLAIVVVGSAEGLLSAAIAGALAGSAGALVFAAITGVAMLHLIRR